MEKKNSYQVFMEEAPEAAAAFNGLIQSLAMPGGLDQKTILLTLTVSGVSGVLSCLGPALSAYEGR
jgi:hypothetical protein